MTHRCLTIVAVFVLAVSARGEAPIQLTVELAPLEFRSEPKEALKGVEARAYQTIETQILETYPHMDPQRLHEACLKLNLVRRTWSNQEMQTVVEGTTMYGAGAKVELTSEELRYLLRSDRQREVWPWVVYGLAAVLVTGLLLRLLPRTSTTPA